MGSLVHSHDAAAAISVLLLQHLPAVRRGLHRGLVHVAASCGDRVVKTRVYSGARTSVRPGWKPGCVSTNLTGFRAPGCPLGKRERGVGTDGGPCAVLTHDCAVDVLQGWPRMQTKRVTHVSLSPLRRPWTARSPCTACAGGEVGARTSGVVWVSRGALSSGITIPGEEMPCTDVSCDHSPHAITSEPSAPAPYTLNPQPLNTQSHPSHPYLHPRL